MDNKYKIQSDRVIRRKVSDILERYCNSISLGIYIRISRTLHKELKYQQNICSPLRVYLNKL